MPARRHFTGKQDIPIPVDDPEFRTGAANVDTNG
jgi:hypothetical protein